MGKRAPEGLFRYLLLACAAVAREDCVCKERGNVMCFGPGSDVALAALGNWGR